MKGIYALIIDVPNLSEIQVGALGVLSFFPGFYVYVGSAQGKSTNIENRLRRHFGDSKKVHWHIDYLLATEARIIEAVFSPGTESFECRVARALADRPHAKWGPKNFGASDCTSGCKSHLIRIEGKKEVIGLVSNVFSALRLTPKLYTQELQ